MLTKITVFHSILSIAKCTTDPASRQSPFVVDPCITLCKLVKASDCSNVRLSSGMCLNLYNTDQGSVVSASSDASGLVGISADSAFFSVSAGGMRCSKACKKTENCPGSFCKPNGHCKGLFWDNLDPIGFCYDTVNKPCSHETPLHCDPLNPNGKRDREIRHAIESSDDSETETLTAAHGKTSPAPTHEATTKEEMATTTAIAGPGNTVRSVGSTTRSIIRVTSSKAGITAIETERNIDGTRDAASGVFTTPFRQFGVFSIIICLSLI